MNPADAIEVAAPDTVAPIDWLRLIPQPNPERLAAEASRRELAAAALTRDRVRIACAALPARYGLSLHDAALMSRVRSPIAIRDSVAASSAVAAVWTGGSGMGKSTLAAAAAREWATQRGGGRIVWARAASLAVASRYHALGAGQPPALAEAERADLLVLDELGESQRTAQWDDVAEVLFSRYERGASTWITTWLSEDQMTNQYGDGFARRVFERAAIVRCGVSA
ncbi:MAG: ATP-binding protein [Terriglobales bacterium]